MERYLLVSVGWGNERVRQGRQVSNSVVVCSPELFAVGVSARYKRCNPGLMVSADVVSR